MLMPGVIIPLTYTYKISAVDATCSMTRIQDLDRAKEADTTTRKITVFCINTVEFHRQGR